MQQGPVWNADHLTMPVTRVGNTVYRRASRGIIVRHGLILVVRDDPSGAFKIPGGGVEPGETDEEALVREIAEETGNPTAHVWGLYFRHREERPAREDPALTFVHESLYYDVTVTHPEQIHPSEPGTTPMWVPFFEAVEANWAAAGTDSSADQWVTRDLNAMISFAELHP